MKKDSDFDALLAGHSPEEARQLQKILADWARGDENGFPVQLALLTRSQWRAAASLPFQLAERQKLWSDESVRLQASITAAAKAFTAEMRTQMTSLQSEITRQSTEIKDATATLRLRLTEAEAYSKEIQRILKDGKGEWDKAKSSFIEERQHLCHAIAPFRDRLERERAFNKFLGFGLAVLVGFAAGVLFIHKQFSDLPVVQLAPTNQK